jgi:hypothetical protein
MALAGWLARFKNGSVLRGRGGTAGHKPACRVATAEREVSQLVRVGKGGGSAPAAAAPERVGHPASQWLARAAPLPGPRSEKKAHSGGKIQICKNGGFPRIPDLAVI